MKKLIFLLTVIVMVSGCSGGEKLPGRIWVNGNLFDGVKPDDCVGISVYENGRVKNVFKDYYKFRISYDSQYMFGTFANKDDSKNRYSALIDLKTKKRLKEFNANGYVCIGGFSPDNKRVYYALGLPDALTGDVYIKNENRLYNIYSLDLETGKQEQITQYTQKGRKIDSLAISPDGKWLIYELELPEGSLIYNETILYNLHTGGYKEIPFIGSDMAWSPDSTKIVFNGLEHEKGKPVIHGRWFYIYDVIHFKLISKKTRNDVRYDYAWSPDGKYIAFIRENGGRALYVMNSDGANPRPLPVSGVLMYVNWSE